MIPLALMLMLVAPAGQEQRVRQLEDALLAPCCWSESVAVHRSEVAARMRAEIGTFVAEGKTDREILDHYKTVYGLRVLREPEGGARVLVYLVPTIATIIGLVVLVFVIRRLLHPIPADQHAHS